MAATFTLEPTKRRIGAALPQPRDERGWQYLNYHGPLALSYLAALLEEEFPTTNTRNLAVRQHHLTYHGTLVPDRPGKRLFNVSFAKYLIYANTKDIDDHLFNKELITHRSPALSTFTYKHAVFLAHVTASLELGARAHEWRFVQEDELLGGRDRSFPTEIKHTVTLRKDGVHVGGQKETRSSHVRLRPDHIFGLEDDKRYATFFVEADRATESRHSAMLDRKNWTATLLKYIDVIENKRHEKELGIKGSVRVLLFFNNRSMMEGVKKELSTLTHGKGKNYICFKLWPEFLDPFFIPAEVNYEIFESDFERVGFPPFSLI